MAQLPEIDDYPARLRFRFCPLCASPLERRLIAGRARLVCPADGWTHYPAPNLAATVVVEHGGGVVLLRRAIPPDVGIWHLPIGHLEFGESPAAMLRQTNRDRRPGRSRRSCIGLALPYAGMIQVRFGGSAASVGPRSQPGSPGSPSDMCL